MPHRSPKQCSLLSSVIAMHFAKHTKYASEQTCKHLFFRCQLMYFEPAMLAPRSPSPKTNNPYAATKAKLSLSIRPSDAGWHDKLSLIKAD